MGFLLKKIIEKKKSFLIKELKKKNKKDVESKHDVLSLRYKHDDMIDFGMHKHLIFQKQLLLILLIAKVELKTLLYIVCEKLS